MTIAVENSDKIQNFSEVIGEFRNEPPTDFSRRQEREAFKAALEEVRHQFPVDLPLVINGERRESAETISSLNPSNTEEVVARSASATQRDAQEAISVANRAFRSWSQTRAEERASILIEAADRIRRRKHFFSAVMVFEAGKTWHEADADTAEAIDFLEYYAREMMRLSRRRRMQPYMLGEHNDLSYHPLGVVGVIAPWNFPLAILAGMTSAALVTGNTVVMKPAEQTPLIGSLFMQTMEEAGLPKGVLNYLPGKGEVAGAELVKSPEVQMIVFTGSRDVGLHIIREASSVPTGQHFVKRVITEMGGKNAMIVDASADLDSAIPEAIYSAFGFSGQKCSALSRLIVLAENYDEALQRMKEGVASLKVGLAEHPGTQVGPVIDDEAKAKIDSYIKLGKEKAKEVCIGDLHGLDEKGSFCSPSVFEVSSADHPLMQEEVFGPVVAVHKVRDFDEALRVANNTPYALTGGVQSRTISNLERARREMQVGNLYLNRTITGAIVERQPFGGFKLSGIGSKAGGPDYLKQFLVARSVTENMMRHGMASLKEDPMVSYDD